MSMDTELERERMPVNVEFGMRGENMFFKIGNQSFLLDYKPAEPGEFEFMQKMLLSAFSSITPCVKTASEPVNARLLECISEAVSAYERYGGICTFEGEPMIYASTLIEIAEIAAEAQQAELVDERVIDRTWVRFCGAFGDGPDAPYPGMIAAFETHYGQSFRDKAWRTEAACWAAAWSKAAARAESALAKPKPDADGWIPWVGGECPVNPNALVRVRFADFLEEGGCRACQYQWHRSNPHAPSDIVAYRVAGESK